MYPLSNTTLFTKIQLAPLFALMLLALIGCQVEQKDSNPIPVSTATIVRPTDTPQIFETPKIVETPPVVMETAAIAEPTIPPSPSITPTFTPLPPVKLAIPDQWRVRAERAVDLLNQEMSDREWQLVTQVDQADISLISGEGHIFVEQQPLALIVPFTTDWEDTTLENAELIISEGHDLVDMIPWSEVSPSQKVLRIDGRFPTDVDYPLQEMWSLQITPGYKQAAAEFKDALVRAGNEKLVHVVAVGDLMLDRFLGYAVQQIDVEYPFEAVSSSLQDADITIGNLESALGDIGEPALKRYQFRAPPEAAESLALAGFDVLSLANNHALDFGPESLLQGIELLNEQGILTVGAGANEKAAHEPNYIEVEGLNMAVLSYVHVPVEASTGFDTESWTATQNSPGLAWANPESITADVQNAKMNSDLVVVLLHSGHEYVEAPSEPQTAAAHAAIDAGADLVIGHHAHILQGIEYYEDGVIIYGTGNFAFEIDGDPQTAIFDIWMDRQGVRQIEIQPAIIQTGGQPRLADETERAAILSQVYYLTNLLNAE